MRLQTQKAIIWKVTCLLNIGNEVKASGVLNSNKALSIVLRKVCSGDNDYDNPCFLAIDQYSVFLIKVWSMRIKT